MKVTKAWFLDAVAHMPDDLVVDLHDQAYSEILRMAGVVPEPPMTWPIPPANITPCSVFGKHMWGTQHCRHCGDPYPPEYQALIPKPRKIVLPLTSLQLTYEDPE